MEAETRMTPDQQQLAAEAAAVAAAHDLAPHPGGLLGRLLDSLDDAELIANDRNASPEAKRSARALADALAAALAAED
jgi:hypothetical protein